MTNPSPRKAIIEQVKVRNFRALQDVEFKGLSPLTALLGANGSGKTTFFNIFAFLSDCFTEGLHKAIAKRGRFVDLRSRGQSGPIMFEIAYREPADPRLIRYHLEIDERAGKPLVAVEWMQVKRGSHGRPHRFLDYREGIGRVITGEVPEPDDIRIDRPLSAPDVLAVSTLGQLAENPRVKSLRDFVTGWHLSYLSSRESARMRDAGAEERLSPSGDNLSNVIQYLMERHPQILSRIFATLRRRIPQLQSVDPVALPTGQLLLMLKDAPFDEGVQARYASDGTLKMLAYLVQLHDPNPPAFLGIEEPENFLHPKLLYELAEECAAASARMQMVVTTHSPFFINALEPEQVWALERDKSGYTKAIRVSDMQGIRAQLEAGAKLGDLWVEGYFQAGNPR